MNALSLSINTGPEHDALDHAISDWPAEVKDKLPTREACPDPTERARLLEGSRDLAIRIAARVAEREETERQIAAVIARDKAIGAANQQWNEATGAQRFEWISQGINSPRDLAGLTPPNFEAQKLAKREQGGFSF